MNIHLNPFTVELHFENYGRPQASIHCHLRSCGYPVRYKRVLRLYINSHLMREVTFYSCSKNVDHDNNLETKLEAVKAKIERTLYPDLNELKEAKK